MSFYCPNCGWLIWVTRAKDGVTEWRELEVDSTSIIPIIYMLADSVEFTSCPYSICRRGGYLFKKEVRQNE